MTSYHTEHSSGEEDITRVDSSALPLAVVVSAEPEQTNERVRPFRDRTKGSFPIRIEVANTSDAALNVRLHRGEVLPVKVEGVLVQLDSAYHLELEPFEQCSIVVEVHQKPS